MEIKSQAEFSKILTEKFGKVKKSSNGYYYIKCPTCDPKDAKTVGEVMERIMCDQDFNCPLKFEWAIATSWAGKS